MIASPTVPLARGVAIPQLGFGLYKVPPEDAERLAGDALAAGYRSLDTAAMYGNEAGVGRAVRRAMSHARAGRLERGELFVTTKIWNTDQGYDAALRAFDCSQAELGLDVVDLCLIHWPCPRRDLYVDTYRALVRLREDGRVRAVGVSNFQPAHLRRLVDAVGEVPAVNQIELHPWLQQHELRALHRELGIATEAWSPLARGHILEDPVLREIAAAHGVSVAQTTIRWHLQEGTIVIPKASSPQRIRENADVFGFALTDEEMARIAALDRGFRSGSHPDDVN
ncbi:aldo/keto reductase [Sinomonas atrocyanea]|uniref:aldo/keto reductase n=1 Tax=Sinomonas atrocyanea TaxID=37927 RepID=UPI00277D7628|nr:aldo/keto reductase [Sinomonas atrocyanea]MDQ0261823.1 diketogulonate reductase-like aldo/keto reductase [Sinomonas atrocyanea]MDR6623560.1 diketogulonate reductase-like aldo/keto reductase [Sinomonas atrocyanea]